MSAQLAPQPIFQAFGPDGKFLVGGKLFAYAAGTSTPQATYIDSTQTTPNTNPIILNAMGQAAVWLNPIQAYKFVLQDAAGNPMWTADNINAPALTQIIIGQLLYPQTAAELAVGVTPTNYVWPPLNVLRYGATGNGATDDTAAIKTAITVANVAGGVVYVPTGSYVWSSTTTAAFGVGVTLRGDGRYASVFKCNNVAAQFFNVTGTGASLRSVGFTSSVTNTGGTWVTLAGTENSMEDWHMAGQFNGVTVTGVATRVNNFWFGQNAGGGNDLIMLCGDSSPSVSDGLWEAQAAPFPVAGLSLQHCTAGNFFNLDIITRGANCAVVPGNGQICDSNNFVECFFDSGTSGLFIQNSGTGSVNRLNCCDCWTGDSTVGSGVSIVNGGSGVMAGFEFVQHSACLNAGSGFVTSGTVAGIRLLGGVLAGNVGDGAFWNHVGDIQMIGTRVGQSDALNGNAAGGVSLTANLTRVNIQGCDVSLNAVVNLSDATTAGIPKIIQACPGYTPVPFAAITVTASPFSFTNNAGAPINVYVQGGTVSGVLVSGLSVTNPTNGLYTVPAGKVIQVTYTVLPTMVYQGIL